VNVGKREGEESGKKKEGMQRWGDFCQSLPIAEGKGYRGANVLMGGRKCRRFCPTATEKR